MRGSVLPIVVAILLAGCATVSEPDVQWIHEARLWLGERETPPPDDAADWTSRPLPDAWGLTRRLRATEGWYRAHVPLPRASDGLWAIYLPRALTAAGAWVNGTLVGDGGGFVEPLPRGGNRPLLFAIPPGLLHAGDNVIDLRVAVGASHPGLLEPFAVGPVHRLQSRYARRVFLQRTLVQGLTLAGLLLGGLIAAIFWRRDRLSGYRWLVAGLACWTLAALDVFLVHSPIPSRVWDWMSPAGQAGFVVCSVIGFHRLLGERRRRLEAGLAAGWTAFAAADLLVPAQYSFTVGLVWGAATLALGIYLMRVLLRAERQGPMPRVARLVPAGIVALLFALHDFASVIAGRTLVGVTLWPYIPAFILLVAFWNMIAHLADALTEAETLNRDLERRVAEKAAALERQHERLRELERARAVAAERERIMQDVHDGMGGQLVSTLALVESGRYTQDALADALRSALDDLRLVIDSLDPLEDDLLAVLATVRGRLEPRLARHGIRFDWQVRDLPALPGFGPERVLQALRIVQEAMTNVLKHACATTIAVRTGEAADDERGPGVFVEIADDGRGLGPERPQGRGLANMARRAGALGGRVTVSSKGAGTVVRLWLPRVQAPVAA